MKKIDLYVFTVASHCARVWHRSLTISCPLVFVLSTSILPAQAQKLQFSYSYVNVTRNNGGGTLENGDIIEVRALAKVNANTSSFYYIDTIPSGTQFVPGSLKLVTNEGLPFAGSGPYTDASNDDAGVYVSTGPARLRVNIGTGFANAQSGANFGLTTGGGTVAAGSIPKFYGSTLFIVVYQLTVTAANNSIMYPTGNFYFDTSGVARKYRFDYGAIKIIQNQGLCADYQGASFSAESSFSIGNTQNRPYPATVPGYVKVNVGANAPQDNFYSIVNNSSATGSTDNTGPYRPSLNPARVFNGYWDIIGDHTNATNPTIGNAPVPPGTTGGYMLMVNAAFTTGEVYRDTIRNLCPNTWYEFSAWVRNICKVCGINQYSAATYQPGVLPNLSFTIDDVDYYTTGNIQHNNLWQKRGFIYKTGPAETSFRITIKNNAAGGGGNDWVLDDIMLSTCYPNLVNSPKDTATACAGYSLTLSDTVKSYYNNYTYYCWEKSTDGINWVSTGVCGNKSPTLVNSRYQYVVDTSFTAIAADNATYYRLKVATTAANLNNPNCSVTNSQKIYMKIYNASCNVLDTKQLNFNGTVYKGSASLFWNAIQEGNLNHYAIERSYDGDHFMTIDSVTTGSAISDQYQYREKDKIAGKMFYRLRLVTKNNSGNTYSRIISLSGNDGELKISAINPFDNILQIDVFVPERSKVEICLFDGVGKPIITSTRMLPAGNSSLSYPEVSALPKGMYFIRAKYRNEIIQQKLFK